MHVTYICIRFEYGGWCQCLAAAEIKRGNLFSSPKRNYCRSTLISHVLLFTYYYFVVYLGDPQ